MHDICPAYWVGPCITGFLQLAYFLIFKLYAKSHTGCTYILTEKDNLLSKTVSTHEEMSFLLVILVVLAVSTDTCVKWLIMIELTYMLKALFFLSFGVQYERTNLVPVNHKSTWYWSSNTRLSGSNRFFPNKLCVYLYFFTSHQIRRCKHESVYHSVRESLMYGCNSISPTKKKEFFLYYFKHLQYAKEV